ncbi:hypothetical protein [Streptomyces microflavus]|uniref:hypothetical protein n=1 Tax=Streptomyces microflavus TaxID=1919 RepID=UPI003F4D5393
MIFFYGTFESWASARCSGCPGEQAMATLKGCGPLRKLCCSTNRITDIVKAVVVLHHAST